MSNVQLWREVIGNARSRGVTFVERSGWPSRGRAGLNVRVHVEHCTSDPRPLTKASLGAILANGHGSMTGNSLCNVAVYRDATAEMIAAGLCWHSGSSEWDGLTSLNRWASATEVQRAQGQSITPSQLHTEKVITEEIMRAFGVPRLRVCDHKECALPRGRKGDRVGINPVTWRSQLSIPLIVPSPEPIIEEASEVIQLNDKGTRVRYWQHQINQWVRWRNEYSQIVNGPHYGMNQLTTDGVFGPVTRGAVAYVQRHLGIEDDGRLDFTTCDAISHDIHINRQRVHSHRPHGES